MASRRWTKSLWGADWSKEGRKEEEKEEEVGGRRKAGSTGTATPGVDAPTGPTQSGMFDVRNRRKHGRWCGVLIDRRG